MAVEDTDVTQPANPYSQITMSDPTTLDPAQFTTPVQMKSPAVDAAQEEEKEAKLLMALSVVGVLVGIAVGWRGAMRNR